jgi:Mannosyltransferase OCH1 and related enzymes
MIPKNLIFCWVGKDVPEYAKFAMDTFGEMNPGFKLIFVHEPDIENLQNPDARKCMSLVKSKRGNIYRHITNRPFAKSVMSKFKGGETTAFTDALRIFLVNKYGGIYLDTDTFPVKPFDSELLSRDFAVINFPNSGTNAYYDIFFFGCEPGFVGKGLVGVKDRKVHEWVFDPCVRQIYYPLDISRCSKTKAEKLGKKFREGTLTVGETLMEKDYIPNYYIDHFRFGSWRR